MDAPTRSRARRLALAIPLLVTTGAACAGTVSPVDRVVIPVEDISLPAAVVASDTIRIRFRYDDSCGEHAVVEVERAPSAVRVRVSKPGTQFPLPCPPAVVMVADSVVVLPAQRTGALTVRFARPDGPDSTRVIAALP